MNGSTQGAFGALLKRYREAAALTQEELAERAELSVRGLIYLERGERRPHPGTTRRLAGALALADPDRAAFTDAAHRRMSPADSSSPDVLHEPPLPAMALIGREAELADVFALLREAGARLLTLTGPGGVGKTRLALGVMDEWLDPGDALFMPLAPLHDSALVPSAIAQALGLHETGGQTPLESLIARLRERPALLVLDNCEHLPLVAKVVAELVTRCPALRVLATSRAALRVAGEREYPVRPLARPDPARLPAPDALLQYPAARLFVERATAARPGFRVTAAHIPAIVGICARLDGLPLAIELAAARTKILPPQALLARLGAAPLGVLAGGARDLPARLQTMRDAIAWSYDLLEPDARALFRRLAVFVGGWTLEAAEAVCRVDGGTTPHVLDGLADLADQSLLRSDEQPDGEARFMMLETIRQYGLERLAASGEGETARRGHAAYYVALAEEAAPALRGPEQAVWLARLEAEHDNLQAALRWSLCEGGARLLGVRLAGALWRFWVMHGHLSEGRRWLEAALDTGDAAPAVPDTSRAHILNAAGNLAYLQDDYGRAVALFEESLVLRRALEDRQGIAAALSNLGNVALRQGECARAMALCEEALALQRLLGDAWGIASTTQNIGTVALRQGKYGRAAALFEEALALRRAVGDTRGAALTLQNLGLTMYRQGAYERAAPLLKEGLSLRRALGDKQGVANALMALAHIAYRQDNPDRAGLLYREGLQLAQDVGDQWLTAYGLEGVAAVAAIQGHAARAAQLFGAAEVLRETVGAPLAAAERAIYDPAVEATRRALDEATFAAAWLSGSLLPQGEAVALALRPVVGDNGF